MSWIKDTRFSKKRYKIKEVAEIIGVPQTTLRFWESEFPELKPGRTPHNQRFYTLKDLETIEIINFLLHTKGLKIEAAKDYLAHNRKNISKRLYILEKLETAKGELQALMEALNLREQKLKG